MILKIAQREYFETVKTKTFILSILFTPLMIGGIIFFANKLSSKKPEATRPAIMLTLVDQTGALNEDLDKQFAGQNDSGDHRQIILNWIADNDNIAAIVKEQKSEMRQSKNRIFGTIDPEVFDNTGKIHLYHTKLNPADIDLLRNIESNINRAIVNYRCKLQGMSPELLGQIRRWVPAERVELGKKLTQDRQTKKVMR